MGGTRKSIQRQVERGFPALPAGCSIQLDRASQAAVLDNIKQALGIGFKGLVSDLKAVGDISLSRFLREADVDLEDVYAGSGRCFTALRRQAGFIGADDDPRSRQVERALSRMLHLDDSDRLDGFRELLGT